MRIRGITALVAGICATAARDTSAQAMTASDRIQRGARMISVDGTFSRQSRDLLQNGWNNSSWWADGEVGIERMVGSRFAVGLRLRSYGGHSAWEPPPASLSFATSRSSFGARIGPRVSYLQPIRGAWFALASSSVSVGPENQWGTAESPTNSVIGSVVAGVGIGRLLTNSTAVVGEVRRTGARNVSQFDGVFPRGFWNWDARLGVRLFVSGSGT